MGGLAVRCSVLRVPVGVRRVRPAAFEHGVLHADPAGVRRACRGDRSEGTLGQGQTRVPRGGRSRFHSAVAAERRVHLRNLGGALLHGPDTGSALRRRAAHRLEAHRGSRSAFRGGVRGLGRAVFRTVLAERGSVHVESHAFTSRGDRRRLAVHVHDARGRAAFLERRGAGGRHLHVQEQAVLVDDGRLRVRLHRVRYRRVDRRRGEAGAVGVLVHRLLPNGRDDGAFRHPACFLGFRPTGRYRQVVVREGSARAGGSSEVQVPAGGHPRRADAHVPVLPLSCEADG